MLAEAVGLAQPGQPLSDHGHRWVAVGLWGLMVPRAAVVDPPVGQIVVAAAEVGSAQGGDHGQVVGRVVDGSQHHEEVADLRHGEEQRVGLGPVGDAGGLQRRLE